MNTTREAHDGKRRGGAPRHRPRMLLHSRHVPAGAFAVIDPYSKKLFVPLESMLDTRAMHREGVPSLCRVFLEGRCRQGGNCLQAHADVAVVGALRAVALAERSCCRAHGAYSDESGLPRDVRVRVMCDNGNVAFVATLARVVVTSGLRTMLAAQLAGQPVPADGVVDVSVPLSSLCRQHACGAEGVACCRFSDTCMFVHVCRELHHQQHHLYHHQHSVATCGAVGDVDVSPHEACLLTTPPATVMAHTHTVSDERAMAPCRATAQRDVGHDNDDDAAANKSDDNNDNKYVYNSDYHHYMYHRHHQQQQQQQQPYYDAASDVCVALASSSSSLPASHGTLVDAAAMAQTSSSTRATARPASVSTNSLSTVGAAVAATTAATTPVATALYHHGGGAGAATTMTTTTTITAGTTMMCNSADAVRSPQIQFDPFSLAVTAPVLPAAQATPLFRGNSLLAKSLDSTVSGELVWRHNPYASPHGSSSLET